MAAGSRPRESPGWCRRRQARSQVHHRWATWIEVGWIKGKWMGTGLLVGGGTVIESQRCLVCSAHFGINGRRTLRRDQGCRLAAAVLNAFRHHWEEHTDKGMPTARLSACSTPFGITRRSTPSPPRSPRPASGAQRLSASLGGAQRSACPSVPHHGVCSTHFGINGRSTAAGMAAYAVPAKR